MIQEEGATEKVESNEETPVNNEAEPAAVEVEESPTESKGLSLEDALDVSYTALKDKEEAAKASRDEGLEVTYKGKRGREEANIEEVKPAPEVKPLTPPAEYNAQEKADFLASSRAQQEAALRLHRARSSSLEEIRRGREELNHVHNLARDIEPFIKAMGLKDNPTVAMQKAIKMWADFQNAEDPRAAAAEYLRAKGKGDAIPAEWLEEQKNKGPSPEITSLQQRIEQLEREKQRETFERSLEQRAHEFREFVSTKNAAGGSKYPSLRGDDTSEEGIRFGSFFGSLVSGETPFSKEFIARTQARIPNLTRTQLLEEAYKFCGGAVDEAPSVTRTQSTQKHLIQSSRAASSRPGNSSRSGTTYKKGKTLDEALSMTWAQLRENEGN